MNNESIKLRTEVFGCESCTHITDFARPSSGGPFYKFPPLIGGEKGVPLLFIGINPRRTKSNFELHDWLMSSPENFSKLSRNQQADGCSYISPGAKEEHYHCHAIVVKELFGSTTAFESKAAVTELLLCASESGAGLLHLEKSRCAEKFLPRVIKIVQPRVVVAVGSTVRKHLERHFNNIIKIKIIEMDHPSYLHGLNDDEKRQRLEPTINELRRALNS